jgi:hypothetical protein
MMNLSIFLYVSWITANSERLNYIVKSEAFIATISIHAILLKWFA